MPSEFIDIFERFKKSKYIAVPTELTWVTFIFKILFWPNHAGRSNCSIASKLVKIHNCWYWGTMYIMMFKSVEGQESVACSVIQATGMVKFQDCLWIGNHLMAHNGLQRVCNIPGVQPEAVRTPGFLWGQTEFQSAWVCVAAWCQARWRVWFPVVAVLGLTRPREVGTFVLFPDVRQRT